MRILILGTLAFLLWVVFGNYWYVCKIKGLCDESSRKNESQLGPANDSLLSVEDSIPPAVDEEGLTENTVSEATSFQTVYVKFAQGSDSIINVPEIIPIIAKLKESISQGEVQNIILVGHTDDQGEADFNYSLGLQRAQSLKRLMVEQEMEESRIRVDSKGEEDPLVENNSADNREKNRRVEILIY